MKVLVTGASGMLGRTVAQTLMANGHAVTVMQRRPAGLACREVLGDIQDVQTVAAATTDQHAVIHLAARSHPPVAGKTSTTSTLVELPRS